MALLSISSWFADFVAFWSDKFHTIGEWITSPFRDLTTIFGWFKESFNIVDSVKSLFPVSIATALGIILICIVAVRVLPK